MRRENLNAVAARALDFFGSAHGLVISRPDLSEGPVAGCSSFDPADLIQLDGSVFGALEDERRRLGVHSVLVCAVKVTPELADEVAGLFPEFPGVAEEIRGLLDEYGQLTNVYVCTHANRGDNPCGSLTISVGGDCYRIDQFDLSGVIERTSLLAKAMARKSVMMFPDVPVLHGGKKGEWVVLDRRGHAVKELSDAVKVALGAVVIKRGIEFLNRLKSRRLGEELGADAGGMVMMAPDTASPDTVSGKYWPNLCRAWQAMGLDTRFVTCLPAGAPPASEGGVGGLKSESALPTGYGVAATALRLVGRLMPKPLTECRFVVEAAGNVTYYTLHALINRYGLAPGRMVAFDPNAAACERIRRAFPGVDVRLHTDEQFYTAGTGEVFDVWVNNGLGNRTRRAQVEWLLDRGVRVFCGGANNFLRKSDERESLEAIWARGAWAWPDEATSGGGWAFAVMDLYARTLGRPALAGDFIQRVIARVERSNVDAVDAAVGTGAAPDGRELWERIEAEIDARVVKSLSRKLPAKNLTALADIRNWKL